MRDGSTRIEASGWRGDADLAEEMADLRDLLFRQVFALVRPMHDERLAVDREVQRAVGLFNEAAQRTQHVHEVAPFDVVGHGMLEEHAENALVRGRAMWGRHKSAPVEGTRKLSGSKANSTVRRERRPRQHR